MGAGQFPLDGSKKARGRARSPRRRSQSGRSLLADPSRVDRGRSGSGPGRHHKRAGLVCSPPIRLLIPRSRSYGHPTTEPASLERGFDESGRNSRISIGGPETRRDRQAAWYQISARLQCLERRERSPPTAIGTSRGLSEGRSRWQTGFVRRATRWRRIPAREPMDPLRR